MQTCNVVGAVPQPAKQEQHVSIGRIVSAGPSAPVQVRAAEQCFSVGLPLILPCDAQKLLDSSSGDALVRDVHLVGAVRNSLLPISSARAPARSHGVSLWLWLCSPVGSASSPPISCSSSAEIPCRFALALLLLVFEIRNFAGAAGALALRRSRHFGRRRDTMPFRSGLATFQCQTQAD